jgi:hypothetical protein
MYSKEVVTHENVQSILESVNGADVANVVYFNIELAANSMSIMPQT